MISALSQTSVISTIQYFNVINIEDILLNDWYKISTAYGRAAVKSSQNFTLNQRSSNKQTSTNTV